MMRAPAIAAALVLAAAPVAALADGDLSRSIGRALFERAWVPAPSSTKANDGLGPLFNARACVACHNGLGRAPATTDAGGAFIHQGMVVKLSDASGRPDPVYGAQVQTSAVPGLLPEARVLMSGTEARLLELSSLPISAETRHGVWQAPALRGLGRLFDVPDEAILALADPDDRGGDGISGRANLIADAAGVTRVGRFGLKASSADLRHQVELAFLLDLGMSTTAFPAEWGDCPTPTCRAAPAGGGVGDPEIRDDLVAMLTDFLASVPPPSAQDDYSSGRALFAATGCASCHVPALPSARGEVRAFTDLLLHDLGDALDGGATEPGVAATEWRTAPLWGIRHALSAGTGLLHDGRAASVADAVRLHGGEASNARRRFDVLSEDDRLNLLRYVEGL
jgi:CxxC motif-containing protein (DUF1111 family)